jgi:hypothetical protein
MLWPCFLLKEEKYCSSSPSVHLHEVVLQFNPLSLTMASTPSPQKDLTIFSAADDERIITSLKSSACSHFKFDNVFHSYPFSMVDKVFTPPIFDALFLRVPKLQSL